MSDATMDLMIKYNAYYNTFSRKLRMKALIPNYYPAIVVPKASYRSKIKETFAKATQKGLVLEQMLLFSSW
jgi:hypothetical protein